MERFIDGLFGAADGERWSDVIDVNGDGVGGIGSDVVGGIGGDGEIVWTLGVRVIDR